MHSIDRQVDLWLAGLSWEQRSGQVFMARGLNLFPGETRDLVRRGWIGNIQARSNEDAGAELAVLQEEASLPPLVGAKHYPGVGRSPVDNHIRGSHPGLRP